MRYVPLDILEGKKKYLTVICACEGVCGAKLMMVKSLSGTLMSLSNERLILPEKHGGFEATLTYHMKFCDFINLAVTISNLN